jgi:hypothetical protein
MTMRVEVEMRPRSVSYKEGRKKQQIGRRFYSPGQGIF